MALIKLDGKILEAKAGMFYRSLSDARDKTNLTGEFAFAADGLLDAVDDMLNEIKPRRGKTSMERLNKFGQEMQLQAPLWADFQDDPTGELYLRYKKACSPRYEDRPSKIPSERFESNLASIRALCDFVEAGALHFMVENNRIMRTYQTGHSFQPEQIDRLIAAVRSHIAGVPGNVVALPLSPPTL
jgi:hypothetical protein